MESQYSTVRVLETMPSCENCGEHVSEQFKRVFADDTGNVFACPNCSANAGIGEVTRERSNPR
jgi:predicted RNA-binding Zn-ribbon protein involved in translation (DUF1610 family)